MAGLSNVKKHPLPWLFGISIFLSFVLLILSLNSKSPLVSKGIEGLPLSLERVGNIGVITIDGVILESLPILEELKEFSEDSRIKALVIRLDSPGGAVGPSQEIYDEVKRWRAANKPVVASMGSVAASGAYYIACGAQQIVAAPGTLTGSIGVIMEMANLEELFHFLKVQPFVIKAGKFKDVGNPGRKMLPEERELLQKMIDQTHAQFQGAVAEGRGLSMEFVKTVADGRIFTGEEARNQKLVDVLGNFDDAVNLAAKLAEVRNPVLVYPRGKRFKNFKDLFSGAVSRLVTSLQQNHMLPISHQRYGALYLWEANH